MKRLVYKLALISSNLSCKLKRKRKISINQDGDLNLNLGCGLAVIENWINIDGSLNALIANFPNFTHKLFYSLSGSSAYYSKDEYCQLLKQNKFVHHDLSYSIPFHNESVNNIFSSHFIEHLFKNDAIKLIEECYRVLRPGGILRVSIPDLEFALSLYHSGKKKEMLGNYFFVEDNNNYYARHKYMYDLELISELLKNAGFKNIKKCEFKNGRCIDVERLDNRPEDSLYVEAEK